MLRNEGAYIRVRGEGGLISRIIIKKFRNEARQDQSKLVCKLKSH